MAKGLTFDLLRQQDVTEIVLADRDVERAQKLKDDLGSEKITAARFDADDDSSIAGVMSGCRAAIGATSYDHNLRYSRAAIASKCHLIDLGGNHDVVDAQFRLDADARKAGIALIPDCGLAPGLGNIFTGNALARLEDVDSVAIRVGGVPAQPKPPLNYCLVFSARGLINEYVEKARVIKNGAVQETDSLRGLETLKFPPPFGEMEAFYTSGGISTLAVTCPGKVKNLDYKTIRYPGHQALISFLFDLGLASSIPVEANGCKIAPRAVLETMLERCLSGISPDVVLVRVTAKGEKNGNPATFTQEIIDRCDEKNGLTAMMRMTAFPAAIIALMLARGVIAETGVLYQERSIPFDTFFEELKKRDIAVSIRWE